LKNRKKQSSLVPLVLTFASTEDPESPHVVSAPGTRAEALCGFRPSNYWARFWIVKPGEGVNEVALCPRCRAAIMVPA
jgi:hypothetical protein